MCASSFPQGLLWENPPSSGPAHTRGDYIFYLSLLGSIFPANSRLMCNEPRKKPSQCMRESTTVIALCEHADRAPSFSSVTTQILFRPCRIICQYPGIYRPLILAGHRVECVCVVYSMWPLTKTSCILTLGGGEDGGHAETQVFRLHYRLTMQSNGITAICDLWVGVCNCGDLTGDRRSNTIKGEDRLHWTAHLSEPSLRLQTQTKMQTWTNWPRNGVNHGPFKRTTVLNTLPPSKSLLPNKGVKRRFCLPPFWGVTGGLKDTNEHENRNKVANSQ